MIEKVKGWGGGGGGGDFDISSSEASMIRLSHGFSVLCLLRPFTLSGILAIDKRPP